MVTDVRTPPAGFGRTLGETARAAQKLHLQLLARQGADFESWVTFTLLVENGSTMPRDVLVADLTGRLDATPSTIAEVLDRMEGKGYVASRVAEDSPAVELTATGEAYFRSLRETVGRATARLLDQLSPEAVETAMGVLRTVGANAETMLAR